MLTGRENHAILRPGPRQEERDTCGGLHAFDLYELPAVETSTDPEYMECYADKKDDRVMGHMIMDAAMTNAVCRTHCEDKEALYYATQVHYNIRFADVNQLSLDPAGSVKLLLWYV